MPATLDEIKKAHRDLESGLHEAISEELNRFKERTGISPESIDVEMVSVTAIGDVYYSYRLGEVSAQVSLNKVQP